MQHYKVTDRVENGLAIVNDCSDNIIRVNFKPGAELDANGVKELYEIYRQLSEGRRCAFIFITEDGTSSLTFDGRKYAAQNRNHYKKACVAMVVKSLPQRIIGNFYYKTLDKQDVPYRLFKTTEEAENWCHQILEKRWKIAS